MTTNASFDPTSFDPEQEEQREAHVASTEAAMRANGIEPIEKTPEIVSYWGELQTEKWYFPDGVQYIEFAPMTESKRQKYQSATKTFMTMNRASGDQKVGFDAGKVRAELLEHSVTDWYMISPQGKPVPFEDRQFGWSRWLPQAAPKHIEALEKAITKANPWLQAEMDEEELLKEIASLEETLESVRANKAGKNDS